jgi:glutathione S-transferase
MSTVSRGGTIGLRAGSVPPHCVPYFILTLSGALPGGVVKLYMNPMSANARRPRLVSRLCGSALEEIVVHLQRGEHQTQDFLRLNPNGRIPALQDGDFVLWESGAICQYLAHQAGRTDLWPADPREQADVSRWQFWNHTQWAPALGVLTWERLMKRLIGQGPPDEAVVQTKLAELDANARMLDDHLARHEWLAAGRLTLAEVAVGCTLSWWKPTALPLERHPHLQRWFERVRALPAWEQTEIALMRSSPP